MMKQIYLLLYFSQLLSMGFTVKAQTTVPALITSNQIWDVGGSPYLVNQATYISAGVTVSVMPGVEITGSAVYKLTIDGEFQALGKWDSIIKISKTELVFTAKSKDYNASTGKGAYFNYCNIVGNGQGSSVISTTNTNIKVNHCVFTNFYEAFYMGGSDTVLSEFTNSQFLGDIKIGSCPIYSYNMASKMNVNNCIFKNSDNLHIYGGVIFKNNLVYKMRTTYLFLSGYSEFKCNRFNNMSGGLTLYLYGYSGKDKFIFTDNTIDSSGSSTNAGMFNLSKNGSNSKFGMIEIHHNNFLKYLGTATRFNVSGTNQIFTLTDTVNCSANYWGSNDSSTIEGFIKDYNDDINIYGRVDFKGFLNSPEIGCSYNNSCAKAYFSYTAQDSVITFKDQSVGSNLYQVKWKFGDGKQDNNNQKTISHTYPKAGVYWVCMYTIDSAENVCDSMCTGITIKNNSKCGASFYFALDTTDPNIVYIINNSTGINSKTNYYWTFGDGNGSSATNPNHTYSVSGRYQICLTIFDTLAGCYSTFCDSVIIDANGMMLIILNEKDILNLKNAGILNSISIFPNPGNGQLTMTLNAYKSDHVKIEFLSASGQLLRSELIQIESGKNETPLNFTGFDSGLYFIHIQTDSLSKRIKYLLQN